MRGELTLLSFSKGHIIDLYIKDESINLLFYQYILLSLILPDISTHIRIFPYNKSIRQLIYTCHNSYIRIENIVHLTI